MCGVSKTFSLSTGTMCTPFISSTNNTESNISIFIWWKRLVESTLKIKRYARVKPPMASLPEANVASIIAASTIQYSLTPQVKENFSYTRYEQWRIQTRRVGGQSIRGAPENFSLAQIPKVVYDNRRLSHKSGYLL